MNEKYPVYIKWYKTLDWILDTVEKYPKNVRFTISGKIVELSILVMEKIIEAIYSKEKKYILQEINLYIEKLRVFFRISYDRKYISANQFEFICTEIEETGKMIGGWMKSCKE
jgi:hypothetical protein